LLATPFIALFYIQLAHHNIWRDELNAFAIAWASPTLASLFHHIHYEGHPWLWYVLLWILAQFTHSLIAFKLLQASIGTAIMLLISLRSPFRRWEKALLLCGYFISFEYTVMIRMYGVVLLLLLLYCWRRTNRPGSPVGSAVLLGLMASTDSMGMLLSGALVLEYAYSAFVQRRSTPLFSARTAARAIAVYAAISAFAVWSARPAKDISWRTTGKLFSHARDLSHLYGAFLRYTIEAFLPVKSPRTGYFWNPQLGRGGPAYAVLFLLVLAALYLALRHHGNLILLVAVTIVAASLFGHLVYMGSTRNYGVTFLAFLAAMWILRCLNPSRLLPSTAYILLVILALSGVWAAIASWRHPFSNGGPAAVWIRAHHLETMPLVGQVDTTIAGLAEHLHRPFYMIECQCQDTYLLFSARRDNYTEQDAPARILEAESFYHGQPLLFADAEPVSPEESAGIENLGLTIKPLAAFTGAEEPTEDIYLYRITKDDAGSPGAVTARANAAPAGALHAQ
jgi:hypothetical protein